MPIIFRVAIKPTPSILKEQDSVDIALMQNVKLKVEGRHDACIVPRAVPVVEAVTAIGILDLLIEKDGYIWMM
ncbi:chorismate synthase [Caloramator sp. mosi_1]|uniref:chorismate synthase n=1 Tax=Caloramator sp. mosi_1 TaxID=3023090 RepID=UPI00235F4BF0|nr:chorismate synthase [Caloramator sp. mosi_1]WDC84676.1 chorismate synthase [Caloramator sp. mosi_1]